MQKKSISAQCSDTVLKCRYDAKVRNIFLKCKKNWQTPVCCRTLNERKFKQNRLSVRIDEHFDFLGTMNIHFILVRPVVPENIGFVCRAMKNMGFASLRVVDSDKYQKKGAYNTAYDSHDILESTTHFDSLSDAVADIDFVIGTTAKSRKLRFEYIPSQEIKSFLATRQEVLKEVAVVFGSESDGLNSEEEKSCDVLSTIPMQLSYPSINLSHSVMIYAYELADLQLAPQGNALSLEEGLMNSFKDQLDTFLSKMEVDKRQPGLFQQVRDKLISMEPQNISLFMTMSRYLRNFIK